MRRVILIALDSVGVDPLGHDRPGSVYGESAFLFSRGRTGPLLDLPDLEQTTFAHGHPRSRVPTWVFAPGARELAAGCTTPLEVHRLVASVAPRVPGGAA